jgi:hypothetical protein
MPHGIPGKVRAAERALGPSRADARKKTYEQGTAPDGTKYKDWQKFDNMVGRPLPAACSTLQ